MLKDILYFKLTGELNREYIILSFICLFLWTKFLLLFQGVKNFGPILTILLQTVKGVALYIISFLFIILIITCFGYLLFFNVNYYSNKDLFSAFLYYFITSIGNDPVYNIFADDAVAQGKIYLKYLAGIFMIFLVIINIIIFVNLIIAFLTNIFDKLRSNSQELYIQKKILIREFYYNTNKCYNSLLKAIFPLDVILIPFSLVFFFLKEEEQIIKYNNFLNYFIYAFYIAAYTLGYFLINIFIIPITYFKICLTKVIQIFLNDKQNYFKIYKIISLIGYIYTGLFIQFYSLFKDTIIFIRELFKQRLPKIIDTEDSGMVQVLRKNAIVLIKLSEKILEQDESNRSQFNKIAFSKLYIELRSTEDKFWNNKINTYINNNFNKEKNIKGKSSQNLRGSSNKIFAEKEIKRENSKDVIINELKEIKNLEEKFKIKGLSYMDFIAFLDNFVNEDDEIDFYRMNICLAYKFNLDLNFIYFKYAFDLNNTYDTFFYLKKYIMKSSPAGNKEEDDYKALLSTRVENTDRNLLTTTDRNEKTDRNRMPSSSRKGNLTDRNFNSNTNLEEEPKKMKQIRTNTLSNMSESNVINDEEEDESSENNTDSKNKSNSIENSQSNNDSKSDSNRNDNLNDKSIYIPKADLNDSNENDSKDKDDESNEDNYNNKYDPKINLNESSVFGKSGKTLNLSSLKKPSTRNSNNEEINFKNKFSNSEVMKASDSYMNDSNDITQAKQDNSSLINFERAINFKDDSIYTDNDKSRSDILAKPIYSPNSKRINERNDDEKVNNEYADSSNRNDDDSERRLPQKQNGSSNNVKNNKGKMINSIFSNAQNSNLFFNTDYLNDGIKNMKKKVGFDLQESMIEGIDSNQSTTGNGLKLNLKGVLKNRKETFKEMIKFKDEKGNKNKDNNSSLVSPDSSPRNRKNKISFINNNENVSDSINSITKKERNLNEKKSSKYIDLNNKNNIAIVLQTDNLSTKESNNKKIKNNKIKMNPLVLNANSIVDTSIKENDNVKETTILDDSKSKNAKNLNNLDTQKSFINSNEFVNATKKEILKFPFIKNYYFRKFDNKDDGNNQLLEEVLELLNTQNLAKSQPTRDSKSNDIMNFFNQNSNKKINRRESYSELNNKINTMIELLKNNNINNNKETPDKSGEEFVQIEKTVNKLNSLLKIKLE